MSSQKYDPPLSEVEMQPMITTAPSQANTPITTAPSQANTPTPAPVSPGGWSPSSVTCPPGLEYLMGLDYLIVNQKNTVLEAFTQWQPKDKYVITDNRGEMVFYIEEVSRTCWELLCVYQSYEFITYDRNQQEILRMIRPFNRCCELPVFEVYSGSTLLGSITEEWSCWRPKFCVRDASGQAVLIIKGSALGICSDTIFEIKSLDEMHCVGEIKKHWRGFAREMFNVSDQFGINFPRDLDVKIKAVLLGGAILLDFKYFGRRSGQN